MAVPGRLGRGPSRLLTYPVKHRGPPTMGRENEEEQSAGPLPPGPGPRPLRPVKTSGARPHEPVMGIWGRKSTPHGSTRPRGVWRHRFR